MSYTHLGCISLSHLVFAYFLTEDFKKLFQYKKIKYLFGKHNEMDKMVSIELLNCN